jgi:hypothetical protein
VAAAPATSASAGLADAATAKRNAARSVAAAGVGDLPDEAAGVAPGPDLPGSTAASRRGSEEDGGVPAGLIAAAAAAMLGLLMLLRRGPALRWLRRSGDGASGPVT